MAFLHHIRHVASTNQRFRQWACLLVLAFQSLVVSTAAGDSAFCESTKSMQPTLFVTPNEFKGTDVERINQAIEVASASGKRVIIPRVNLCGQEKREIWLLDSAILLRSDTTLELDNCHIKLSDRCRDNLIRSGNCGLGITEIKPMRNIHIRGIGRPVLEGADRPRATGGADKTLGTQTYGTDAGVAEESQFGDWRNMGIVLSFVEDFSIENIRIADSHCLAISMERCAHGLVRDIDIASSGFKVIDGVRQTILNQDGIEVVLGCHDILITNITGYSGDDFIALCAIPLNEPPGAVASWLAGGTQNRGGGLDDIRHIIIRDIQGYCQGGHHIVRLLNTPELRMHDVLIDGLIDTSPPEVRCKAAVKIGDHSYGGGISPLGDTSRIIVTNVVSRSTHTIQIGGSLCDSIISNIVQYDSPGEAITYDAGPEYVRGVTSANIYVAGK